MQGDHLFEYAVIRIVPQVEREEFLNAGIIVFSKKEGFLKAIFEMDMKRIKSCFPCAETTQISTHLDAFCMVAAGDAKAGPIALLDPPSRFRWLTAKRSTIVQTSAVHPGMSKDLDATLRKLFTQLVTCNEG